MRQGEAIAPRLPERETPRLTRPTTPEDERAPIDTDDRGARDRFGSGGQGDLWRGCFEPRSPSAPAPAPAPGPAATAPPFEALLPALVQRVAWCGDTRRASVFLELGSGRYAGTSLVVHADHGKVRVEVHGPLAEELSPRLAARLDDADVIARP